MKKEKNKSRPPVVVILGHVDHGKSSILEAIKDLKITEKESGGITQHIGAYEVDHLDKKITFIDTPGHEAFSSMRSRGARVADIAVLVVAADEGVKPQTKEAVKHINEAKIPMVVAINKIDKPEADPQRTANHLAEEGVFLESIGGKVSGVLVSAKEKKGIEDLLEMILLVSEMEDLKEDVSSPPSGIIVESHLDPLKGVTATVIVEKGIFKKGDFIATPTSQGKIKNMTDSQGNLINEARPSTPAVIFGLEKVPVVGNEIKTFKEAGSAKRFAQRKEGDKAIEERTGKPETAEKEIKIILKADVYGSLEAIERMLKEIPQDRVFLNILKMDVGDVNESDIKMAKSSDAKIMGFRVKTDQNARNIAERDGIIISTFDVIYELIEKAKKMVEKSITPRIERIDLGKAKVLTVFIQDKKKQIFGCRVIQGEIRNKSNLEVFRKDSETEEEKIVGKGKVTNLKRGDKNIEKVFSGEECGILYEGDVKIGEGDIILSYVDEEEKL